MASPYRKQPRKAFWRTLSAQPGKIPVDLFTPRFPIGKDDRIATAGSCFAQHIAAHLRRQGYNVLDVEPAPRFLSVETAQAFGYATYSARYGNIYTARQFLQLVRETRGKFQPADAIWEKKGRFYDALRPSVEPEGLDDPAEVVAHRADHLVRVRQLFKRATLMIFTLGLTETFVHRKSGTVYPTAPETIAGTYDPAIHVFKNFSYDEVLADLIAARALLKAGNPGLRFLFTVSPVPLTATASGQHVLIATMRSKSVLRAAAGAMYDMFDDVDYFPSYEIVATPFLGPLGYGEDLRSIRPETVTRVMKTFSAAYGAAPDAPSAAAAPKPQKTKMARSSDADVICEEKLLEAFVR